MLRSLTNLEDKAHTLSHLPKKIGELKKHLDFNDNVCVSLTRMRQLVRLCRDMRILCVRTCSGTPDAGWSAWGIQTLAINYVQQVKLHCIGVVVRSTACSF